MKGWFDQSKEPELPTPGPCPQCGREKYKTRRLQHEWARSGRALCHTCWGGYHKPTHPSMRRGTKCPVCSRAVRNPGTCRQCKERGLEAIPLFGSDGSKTTEKDT